MTSALSPWIAVPAIVLLVTGGLLALIGAIGLLRLRDFHARLHPPTMGSTLGAGCLFTASMLVSSAVGDRAVVHEVLLAVFVFLTAPVGAMLLARAALYRSGARDRRRSSDGAESEHAAEGHAGSGRGAEAHTGTGRVAETHTGTGRVAETHTGSGQER